MEEKETKILPTMKDKWVSLHPSFGLVCWCDDEQLGNEFKNLKNVHFISFGELTTQEKQTFQDKVSGLFRILGIPFLSEVHSFTNQVESYLDSHLYATRSVLGNYLVHNLIHGSISVKLISKGCIIYSL